jgi:hypothetical protein
MFNICFSLKLHLIRHQKQVQTNKFVFKKWTKFMAEISDHKIMIQNTVSNILFQMIKNNNQLPIKKIPANSPKKLPNNKFETKADLVAKPNHLMIAGFFSS